MTSSQRTGGALKKPIVMLIDLDHTLQGDIRPQIMEYELVRDINRKITNGPKIRYHVAGGLNNDFKACLLYTSPSPRDVEESRMPSSA